MPDTDDAGVIKNLKKTQFGQFSNLIQIDSNEENKTRNDLADKEAESSFMLSKNRFKLPSKAMLADESMSHNLLTIDGNSKVGLSPKYFRN